jgi:hypothetical protein
MLSYINRCYATNAKWTNIKRQLLSNVWANKHVSLTPLTLQLSIFPFHVVTKRGRLPVAPFLTSATRQRLLPTVWLSLFSSNGDAVLLHNGLNPWLKNCTHLHGEGPKWLAGNRKKPMWQFVLTWIATNMRLHEWLATWHWREWLWLQA